MPRQIIEAEIVVGEPVDAEAPRVARVPERAGASG